MGFRREVTLKRVHVIVTACGSILDAMLPYVGGDVLLPTTPNPRSRILTLFKSTNSYGFLSCQL